MGIDFSSAISKLSPITARSARFDASGSEKPANLHQAPDVGSTLTASSPWIALDALWIS